MYPYYHELNYPDVAYLKTFYPNSIGKIYDEIIDAVDRLEYEGSILYDEVPDYESFLRLTDEILASLSGTMDMNDCCKELVMVLLSNEFLHRRIRKKEYCYL